MVKPTDATLNNLLGSRQFFTADLITITLNNGSTLHYCSGSQDITFNGNTYTAGGIPDSTVFGGPYWDRKDNKAKVVWKIGTGNDSLVIDCIPGAAFVTPQTVSTLNFSAGFSANADVVLPSGFGSTVPNPRTISLWFKSTISTAASAIVSIANSTSSPTSVGSWDNPLYININGNLQGGWFDGSSVRSAASTAVVTDGNWHHAVLTVALSSFVNVYLDGVRYSTTIGTPETAPTNYWLGNGKGTSWPNTSSAATMQFSGKMSDVRFYNSALASSDVATLFAGGNVTFGLQARYFPPTSTAVSLADASGNGNNASTADGSTVTTQQDAPAPLITVSRTGGLSFLNAIRTGVFDNADFLLRRAFMSVYGTLPSTNCAVTMFQGVVGMINADRAMATFQIDDYRSLFNQQMPKWLYAPTCQNTLYDTNCSLSAAANASSGTVSSGSSLTFVVSTSAGISAQASGWFDNGKVSFLTGANAGLAFAVSSFNTVTDTITFTSPLPFALTTADTFLAYPGCDRSTGTGGCGKNWASTGSNIVNFRGMPYIPDPGTAF